LQKASRMTCCVTSAARAPLAWPPCIDHNDNADAPHCGGDSVLVLLAPQETDVGVVTRKKNPYFC